MPKRDLLILFGSLSLIGLAACGSNDAPASSAPKSDISESTNRGTTLALACSGCHSDLSGAIASLSDYSEDALVQRLQQYKTETDGTTVMHRLARGYSDEDIALVSAALARAEAAP